MAQSAAHAMDPSAHGAANGRGTHGGVVGTGGHAAGHSIDRRPVGGSRMGEQMV